MSGRKKAGWIKSEVNARGLIECAKILHEGLAIGVNNLVMSNGV